MSIRLSVEWRERLASPLTWHYAGAVVLLVLSVTLAIRFGLDLADTSSSRIDALANKQIELKALDMQTARAAGVTAVLIGDAGHDLGIAHAAPDIHFPTASDLAAHFRALA